ncbi:general stress protein [Dactylosporangium sp. NPDC049742]|uniref:general stress protein n=1 Tax=Dactylosporangium sp. NPDC049742 TaxID=3154737 RepID=UPI00341BB247
MTYPNRSPSSLRNNDAMPRGPSGTRPATHDDNTADRRAGTERATIAVASYPDYARAQRAVDFLSDNEFPVDRVRIVGSDLRLVEQVHGRMTTGRAALAGAGTGAWFGLLIGILFGAFAVGAWWRVLVFAVVAGAVWGAAFGALAHAMTRGQRDFTSTPTLQADNYTITVDADVADRAREMLSRLPTDSPR